jgi:hypothetical protein
MARITDERRLDDLGAALGGVEVLDQMIRALMRSTYSAQAA